MRAVSKSFARWRRLAAAPVTLVPLKLAASLLGLFLFGWDLGVVVLVDSLPLQQQPFTPAGGQPEAPTGTIVGNVRGYTPSTCARRRRSAVTTLGWVPPFLSAACNAVHVRLVLR